VKHRIVIIDDEITFRLSLEMILKDEGFEVESAATIKDGWEKIEKTMPFIVLLDIRLPDGNGLELLHQIRERYDEMAVIILTAFGDTKTAVQAIKEGAYDYLTKPFEIEELQMIIQKWIKQNQLEKEVERYREEERRFKDVELIGKSVPMQKIKREIQLIAKSKDTTVLIEGETGTGKEVIARSIHQLSERQGYSIVSLNCGAIPPHLVESELFGYEKGAFTGAIQQKKGLIEFADRGTLFLDEVGELPLDVQVKLLRFLENKKVKRVGGLKEIEVDVRIIGATNRNLIEMINDGSFRSDLYYRLNVFPLKLPPLRERGDDVILLTEKFLAEYSYIMKKPLPQLTENAKKRLLNYQWPGNIRELRNVIERVMILHQNNEITENDLDFLVSNKEIEVNQTSFFKLIAQKNFSLDQYLESIEKELIIKALEQTKWKITKTADLLGISRFSLQRRIDKYKIH